MKWIVTAFLALVFAVLSFNAFIGNKLGTHSGNRIIGLLSEIYGWLMTTIGDIPTGVLFAACAVGIVVAAVRDGRSASQAE